MSNVNRRDALRLLGLGALGALGACVKAASGPARSRDAESGHLTARPGAPTKTADVGLTALGLGPAGRRDGVLYLPASYAADAPTPLVVLFHGATQSGSGVLPVLQAQADAHGFAILAPDSRGTTWDLASGDYGDDVAFLDRALAWTFDRVRVDPARIFAAGFSDGASYSLSLGVTNGDLFRALLGFSPGFLDPATPRGRPPVFVSHGAEDPVLPVAGGRAIVDTLRGRGYDVTYVEFDGVHEVPADVRGRAGEWIAGF